MRHNGEVKPSQGDIKVHSEVAKGLSGMLSAQAAPRLRQGFVPLDQATDTQDEASPDREMPGSIFLYSPGNPAKVGGILCVMS